MASPTSPESPRRLFLALWPGHNERQQLAQLAPRVVVITPRPNLWDRLNPHCCSLHPRDVWLHVLRQVGLYEDSVESAALFGNNYEQDPDMTLVMLKLAR